MARDSLMLRMDQAKRVEPQEENEVCFFVLNTGTEQYVHQAPIAHCSMFTCLHMSV